MAEEFEIEEVEISDDDILYYLVDEEGNEVGFVIEEDGAEVECYYEGFEDIEFEVIEETAANPSEADDGKEEPGYLYKLASIAGHEGGKAREKAEKSLDKMRGKAEVQAKKAKEAATEQAKKAKSKADEFDLGITREGVTEMTQDLNAVAKEGLDTARELKEAYDDIMGTFDFLKPGPKRGGFSSGGSGLPGFKK